MTAFVGWRAHGWLYPLVWFQIHVLRRRQSMLLWNFYDRMKWRKAKRFLPRDSQESR